MSDLALEAQGMKVYIGDVGSPPNLVEIPEVRSIRGPDGQASWMDTTDLASTGKEGRPGLADFGQVRLSIFYVPDNAVHLALYTAFKNRTMKRCGLDFTDTAPVTKWEADVYVTGFSIQGEVDGAIQAEVTLRISGSITQVQ